MWWYLVLSWLVAVTAVVRGGVPPAPLHVGGYQRRLAFADQGSQVGAASAGAAALEELFRDADQDWEKRDGGQGNQHMLRSPRGSRQYDVPQIGKSF